MHYVQYQYFLFYILLIWGGAYAPNAPPAYGPVAPADGSSTRGGSTSVCGRVRSPHISGGRPAAGSKRAYSLGWDRQTNGRVAVSLNALSTAGGITPVLISGAVDDLIPRVMATRGLLSNP